MVGDELREAEEDLAALRRRDEPPVLVRGLRRGDGAVDVLRAGARERADQLAVGGTGRVEGLAGGGVDPLAVDVVLERACRRRHGRQPSRASALSATFGTTRPSSPSVAFHSVNAASISDMSAPRSARRIGLPASGSTRYWYQVISHANVSTSSLFTPERGTIETSGAPERACDAFDRAAEEARVEEVGGLHERRLRVRETPQDGLRHDGLRLAVRGAEELRPARALPSRPRGECRRDGSALAHPAVVEREVLAERADVDELDTVWGESERVLPLQQRPLAHRAPAAHARLRHAHGEDPTSVTSVFHISTGW